MPSRPSRARGLKRIASFFIVNNSLSRPTRARGLKPVQETIRRALSEVAPHAGAWIETLKPGDFSSVDECRAPRGRVD